MELPTLPRYEWSSELFHVRSQLSRERKGFTLKLLGRTSLPVLLRTVHELRMPVRPPNLQNSSVLDRAEHTGTPVDLVIRAGTVLGRAHISVADFERFADATPSSE